MVVLFVNSQVVSGQFDMQVSQYAFAHEAYNPACAGELNQYSIMALYRQQWVGVTNAPQETFFSATAAIKKNHGVGLLFSNDNAGIFSTQSVYMQYAFKYRSPIGIVSLGTNLGFVNQTVHGDSVRYVSSDYHSESDPTVSSSKVNALAFDVGIGAYLLGDDYYVGLSLLHLADPIIDLDTYVRSFVGRTLYFTVGYSYVFSNKKYLLSTSGLLKSDFVSWQLDLNLLLHYNDRYYGGIGWRYQDAIVFMLGFDLNIGLSIGYSFDLSTTEFITESYGSHEVYLRYSFLIGKKRTNKYKSVRIL